MELEINKRIFYRNILNNQDFNKEIYFNTYDNNLYEKQINLRNLCNEYYNDNILSVNLNNSIKYIFNIINTLINKINENFFKKYNFQLVHGIHYIIYLKGGIAINHALCNFLKKYTNLHPDLINYVNKVSDFDFSICINTNFIDNNLLDIQKIKYLKKIIKFLQDNQYIEYINKILNINLIPYNNNDNNINEYINIIVLSIKKYKDILSYLNNFILENINEDQLNNFKSIILHIIYISTFLYKYNNGLSDDIKKYYSYYIIFNNILKTTKIHLTNIINELNNNYNYNLNNLNNLKMNVANYLTTDYNNILLDIPKISNNNNYKPLYCYSNNCNNINTNIINYFNNINQFLDLNNNNNITYNNDIIYSNENFNTNNGPYKVQTSNNLGCNNIYSQMCFDLVRIVHKFNIKEIDIDYKYSSIFSEYIDISIPHFYDKNNNFFTNKDDYITQSQVLYYKNFIIQLDNNYNFISTNYIIHDLELIIFDKGNIPWLDKKINKRINRYLLFIIFNNSQSNNIINFWNVNKYIRDKFIELKNYYVSKIKYVNKYFNIFIQQAYEIITTYFNYQLIYINQNLNINNDYNIFIYSDIFIQIINQNYDTLKLNDTYINLDNNVNININQNGGNKKYYNKYLKYKKLYLSNKKSLFIN